MELGGTRKVEKDMKRATPSEYSIFYLHAGPTFEAILWYFAPVSSSNLLWSNSSLVFSSPYIPFQFYTDISFLSSLQHECLILSVSVAGWLGYYE
jgi:hypothetical protein